MALSTVRVPPGLEPLFAEAERVVSAYFADQVRDPTHGSILVSGERYVMVSAASLSVEFLRAARARFGEDHAAEASWFAQGLLFDLAHAIGRADARRFHAALGLSDPLARLSAGPVHFAHTGWAFVDIDPVSQPTTDEEYFIVYQHPYSFEAEAWLASGERPERTVCSMNAGYSSGWCEESFGLRLVSHEVECRARGDATCRFVMAPPPRLEGRVREWLERERAAGRGGLPGRAELLPARPSPTELEAQQARSRALLEQSMRDRTDDLRRTNELFLRELAERSRAERRLAQMQRLESLGRLAGSIAHDFNNLMAVVLLHARSVERSLPEGAALRGQLEEIVQASDEAANLARQLLRLVRSTDDRDPLVDLGQLVDDALPVLARLAGARLRVTATGERDLLVEVERSQVEQILHTLVASARDGMPQGGFIRVTTDQIVLGPDPAERPAELPPGRYARITVDDAGPPLAQRGAGRPSPDPFDEPSETARDQHGLWVVQGIARRLRGLVTLADREPSGVRAALWLPLDGPSSVVPRPPEGALPTGTERLLVIEDRGALREALGFALRELGYTVDLAATPDDALALAEAGPRPDLLVSDIALPTLSGPVLVERLRARWPDVPALFLSGHWPGESFLRGLEGQRAAFLAKPFSTSALAQRVRLLLDHAGPARNR